MKIYYHNGTGFDFAIVLNTIATLRTDPAYSHLRFGKHTLEQLRFQPVNTNNERLLSIRFGPLRFVDSMQFTAKYGLGALIDSQLKLVPGKTLEEAFPLMAARHPLARVNLEKLLRKIPFPYRELNETFWEKPALFPVEAYANDLRETACTAEEYAEVQDIIETYGMRTAGEYHDCYLWTDVLALADCFEAMRGVFFKLFRLDMAHSLTMPSASMRAMKLQIPKSFQLITEENGG